MGRHVSEFGYSVPVMMNGIDVDALDNYILKKGYLSKEVLEMSRSQRWFRSLLVQARKNALHDIMAQVETLNRD